MRPPRLSLLWSSAREPEDRHVDADFNALAQPLVHVLLRDRSVVGGNAPAEPAGWTQVCCRRPQGRHGSATRHGLIFDGSITGRLLPAVSKDAAPNHRACRHVSSRRLLSTRMEKNAAEKAFSELDHIDGRERDLLRHAGRVAQEPGRGLLGIERFGGRAVHRHDHLEAP